MFSVLRSLPRLLAVTAASAVLAVPALLAAPSPATAVSQRVGTAAIAATATPSQDVTWMVRPSDGEREDGRPWIERELAPGDVVEEHLLIRNLSARTIVFGLSAADGYFTETGRFNMLTADRASTGAGTWIDVEDTVEVASGADVVVPFTIAVPANATPGDHPAGVAASIRTGEGEVGVESRVGFRVMTRVTGTLAPAVASTVDGRFEASWNPFEAGSLEVDYTLSNDGNTRIAAAPRVTIGALFGLVSRTVEGEPVTEMAPGESRRAVLAVPDLWPLFGYSVSVEPGARVAPLDASSDAVTVTSSSTTVTAVPWSQLATLFVAVLLVWWLIVDRRRRERRLLGLLDEARAQHGAAPPAQLDADAGASTRQGRRVTAGGTLAVGLLALGTAVLTGPPPASADVAGSGSVRIEVGVAASPSPSSSTPSPIASASPTPGKPAPPGASEDLPSTGSADAVAVLAVALAFSAAGALALLAARRRRSRGAGG